MLLTWPPRCSTYAAGTAAGMSKRSSTWKTIDSSVAVRGVPTSVEAPIVSGSVATSGSRKRRLVCAALGPSSRMPSSSSSETCSLSGTRLSR